MKGKAWWKRISRADAKNSAKNTEASAQVAQGAAGAAGAADAAGTDAALLAALGLTPKAEKKRLPGRKLLFGAGAALALGALVFGGIKLIGSRTKEEATYREYTVARGDITVGQSESSSVSLNRETIEFPVSATVQEVYVKAGSSVKAGDALMKLDVQDIKDSLASFELEVQMAELELQKAQLDEQTKLLSAEQQLASSELSGDLASLIEGNTKEELQQALTTAEKNLADAKEKYEAYCMINTTFDEDYIKLKNLEDSVDKLTTLVNDYKTTQSNAKTFEDADSALTSALSSLKTQLTSYYKTMHGTVDSNGKVDDNLQEAIDVIASGSIDVRSILKSSINSLEKDTAAAGLISAWNKYVDALTTYEYALDNAPGDSYARLTAYVSSANTQLASAQTAYNEFYEYYKNVYGDIEDAEDMADAVYDGEKQVEKTKLALSQQEVSGTQKKQSAEQATATAENAAEVASATYELTQMELSQAVEAAQDDYTTSSKQLAEVKALIEDDGVVKAPCNGMVAEVSVEEDDDLEVFIDEDTHTILRYATLLTMTDISGVYVPITISEEDILSVYIGQAASVTMNAFSGRTFDAEVDTITIESSRSGAATVSYTVNVRFTGENTLDLYEGMSADVTLIQRAAPDVLYVNYQAVTNTGGAATVLVKGEDGAPVETAVTTGFCDGRYVEILSGLLEGDTVLVQSTVGQG